jgi:hypothetical protein
MGQVQLKSKRQQEIDRQNAEAESILNSIAQPKPLTEGITMKHNGGGMGEAKVSLAYAPVVGARQR